MTGAGAERGRLAAAALLVGAVTLAPVALSPILATNDGPSHVYNAALAAAVRRDREPFADYFRVERGMRPNMASHTLLTALGPRAGWDAAERVVAALALAATFAVLVALVVPAGLGVAALLTPLAGWLASSWFVWGGAYDFALSIPVYAALLLTGRIPVARTRNLVIVALLGLLYVTHFFTFAAGIALVGAVIGWRALTGQESWRPLWVVLPAAALLLVEMASGGPGTGAVLWGERWDALRGLVIGDFVVSVSRLDLIGGVAIMATVWAVVALRWHAARRDGARALTGAEVFGVALLALSLIAPHGVGEGTYIPIRMRYLGTVALIPSIAQAAAAIRPARLAVAAGVLGAALVVHTVQLVQDAQRTHRDAELMDRLVTAAGAGRGSWVVTRLTMYRRGLFHVAGYRHLIGRVAMRHDMIVLDNYEALYGVFATIWRDVPDWIEFRPSTDGLTVRLAPGSIRWPGGVYVLHESDRRLQVADPRLTLGRSAAAGGYAVTHVRRLD